MKNNKWWKNKQGSRKRSLWQVPRSIVTARERRKNKAEQKGRTKTNKKRKGFEKKPFLTIPTVTFNPKEGNIAKTKQTKRMKRVPEKARFYNFQGQFFKPKEGNVAIKVQEANKVKGFGKSCF